MSDAAEKQETNELHLETIMFQRHYQEGSISQGSL